VTLFGTTLDQGQIFALVGLLATLALWLVILGRERGYARWFRQWEAGRKSQREAEQAAGRPADPNDPPKGPWG
jgi:hypothetical protein